MSLSPFPKFPDSQLFSPCLTFREPIALLFHTLHTVNEPQVNGKQTPKLGLQSQTEGQTGRRIKMGQATLLRHTTPFHIPSLQNAFKSIL